MAQGVAGGACGSLLVLLILSVIPNVARATTSPLDLRALKSLRGALHVEPSNPLKSWAATNNADPCESWYGVNCERRGNRMRVVSITLTGLAVRGQLNAWDVYPAAGELQHLRELELNGNVLSGSIPSTIGGLTSLQNLSLGVNILTGTIPTQLGSLKNLFTLNLDGGYTEDQRLTLPWAKTRGYGLPGNVFGNMLSGTIPSTFKQLKCLKTLILHRNVLTGSIPREVGDMESLMFLDFSGNRLNGTIPGSLGKLQKLVDIQLDDNALSGSIPHQLTNCSALEGTASNIPEVLVLEGNQLIGALPKTLPMKLAYLDVHANRLTGTIPAKTWNASAGYLHVIMLHQNELSGSVPPELGSHVMHKLEAVSLAYNDRLCGDEPQHIPSPPQWLLEAECDHNYDAHLWPSTNCSLYPEKVGTRIGTSCMGVRKKGSVRAPAGNTSFCGTTWGLCEQTPGRCCEGDALCVWLKKFVAPGTQGRVAEKDQPGLMPPKGFHQCIKPDTLPRVPTANCNIPQTLWNPCGGARESGSRCCEEMRICQPLNYFHAMCVPAPAAQN